METIKGFEYLSTNSKIILKDFYNNLSELDKESIKSVIPLKKSDYIIRIDFKFGEHKLLRRNNDGQIELF
ncbi:hypothetical protein J2Z35_001215 [Acetoanaerobium pronyense]|uniref:Uncharacterized protein n=1 Tax=Acetoanaerobium pronyense TaxID=1482736 RepID=A0ABS4KJX3_9FIRM|nr:hypothetical protein [Acetoanaerobium pronyense]MBP2027421.1 hypothetical protein [Acetoanaerobium pronyense]